jgi:hypothetical protein
MQLIRRACSTGWSMGQVSKGTALRTRLRDQIHFLMIQWDMRVLLRMSMERGSKRSRKRVPRRSTNWKILWLRILSRKRFLQTRVVMMRTKLWKSELKSSNRSRWGHKCFRRVTCLVIRDHFWRQTKLWIASLRVT